MVAYQTAYLKANYPAEFLAAAMTNEMADTAKLAAVLDEARTLGIVIRPPSVNHSDAHFTVEDGQIRFGLGAIKGVGLGAIEHLVDLRAASGPFARFFDFVKAVDLRILGKKAIESLILSGALDGFDGHRASLVAVLDAAVQYAQKHQQQKMAGMISLFGGDGAGGAREMEPAIPLVPAMPRADALRHEKELIGLYVSGHPLDAFGLEVRAFATHRLGEVAQQPEAEPSADKKPWERDRGPLLRLCGLLSNVQRRTTKSGKPMAFATFEDYTGAGEVTLFARELERYGTFFANDEVVLVKGFAEVRGGAVRITVQELTPMWKAREDLVRGIVLALDLDTMTEADVARLAEVCEAHRCVPGGPSAKLYVDPIAAAHPGLPRLRSRKFVVEPTPELLTDLVAFAGKGNVSLLEAENG